MLHCFISSTQAQIEASKNIYSYIYSNVYGNLDCASMNKLQLAINNCARFVYNKIKYDHISQCSVNILLTTLASFLNIRNLIQIHKIIYRKLQMP